MSRLDDLAETLSAAAANPPKLSQLKVIVPNPKPVLPPTSSTGARRPVLRSSHIQHDQVRDRTVDQAKADARRTLLEQAKKALLG